MGLDRAWYTMKEAAIVLGRKPDTLKHWITQGRIEFRLNLVHGGRVERIFLAEEVQRVLLREWPANGQRPDSRVQQLWNKRSAQGKKGAATMWAKRRAKEAEKEQMEREKYQRTIIEPAKKLVDWLEAADQDQSAKPSDPDPKS